MALSDFWPYGAPELLEGASARMARSTLLASLGVALMVVTLGALRPATFTAVVVPEPPPDVRRFMPPIDIDPPPVARPQPVTPPAEPTSDEAVPVPVPDKIAPEPVRTEPVVDPRANDGPFERPTTPGGGEHDAAPAKDPEPDVWVYVDEMPRPLRCGEARYPDLARSAGVEGTVRVRMLVGLDGRVERAILAPRGSVLMLDEAALQAALTCVFTPATSGGHPVKVWVSQDYRFTLH